MHRWYFVVNGRKSKTFSGSQDEFETALFAKLDHGHRKGKGVVVFVDRPDEPDVGFRQSHSVNV
jgi:hypothetical protein